MLSYPNVKFSWILLVSGEHVGFVFLLGDQQQDEKVQQDEKDPDQKKLILQLEGERWVVSGRF